MRNNILTKNLNNISLNVLLCSYNLKIITIEFKTLTESINYLKGIISSRTCVPKSIWRTYKILARRRSTSCLSWMQINVLTTNKFMNIYF